LFESRYRVRLKPILIACFVLVALVPVVTLGLWPLSRPIENEVAHVAEKHLLVARHIRESLLHYQRALKTAVNLVAAHGAPESGGQARNPEVVRQLQAHLRNIHIQNVCSLPAAKGSGEATSLVGQCRGEAAQQITSVAYRLGTAVTFRFSGVQKGANGKPALYLARRSGDRIIIARFGTDHIRAMQQKVFFGQQGPAAIVDQTGRVLAHPKASWVQSRKPLTKVAPVKAMMEGKTGVMRFWSPAIKADMIAGYTGIPGAGWGVMVPQPYSELLAKAKSVREQIEIAALIGILIAVFVALLLSRQMAQPIQAVAEAVRRVASGDASARVPVQRNLYPSEMRNLAAGFNAMSDTIEDSKSKLLQRVDSRTQALSISEQQLRAALDQAKAAVKAKTAFLAQMSHELRTPLNAILGYSEMMEREILGPIGQPRYREYLGHIHESGSILRDLIGEILDATKLEDGSMTITECDVPITKILERAYIQATPLAMHHDVGMKRIYGGGLPTIYGDETRLLQIVSNLLTNAIKFTRPGGYVIIAAGTRKDGRFSIRVRDNGVGMNKDDLSKLGEPFHQADRNRHHPAEGSGLGVTISVALARLHGGDIHYRSAPGIGTLVEFVLPRARIVSSDLRQRRHKTRRTAQNADAARTKHPAIT